MPECSARPDWGSQQKAAEQPRAYAQKFGAARLGFATKAEVKPRAYAREFGAARLGFATKAEK
jgi:hypothetical protein